MKSQTHQTPHIFRGRGLARGGFLFCLLAGLTACGSSGGSSGAASPATPVLTPAQTKVISVSQGLGFLCWEEGASPEHIWCWASEQAALDNGDAGRIGLTDLAPALMYTAPGTTTFQAYDHGICFAGTCLGSQASTANVQRYDVTCTVTAPDTLSCPGIRAVLTFSGMTFARIEHTPTYKTVRRTCRLENPPYISEGALATEGVLLFGRPA